MEVIDIKLPVLAVAFTLLTSVSPALAGEVQDSGASPAPTLELELGGGGSLAPRFEGSDDYLLSPYPIIRLRRLNFGGLNIDATDTTGFSVSPSFRYLAKRDSSDSAKLGGIPDADAAFELGAGVAYEAEFWRVFGTLRFGVAGHHGIVGEIGGDLLYRPDPQWRFAIGPRLSFADDDYMDYYFRVRPGFAPLPAYNPDGGLKSAGVEASARYDFDHNWSAEGTFGWNRLVGDAGKSPVTKAGDDDQFLVKIGIARRFSFGP